MSATAHPRRTLVVATSLGLILALTACSADPPVEQAVGQWVEPGWMAGARQEVEDYESALINCLEQQGVQSERIIGGGVSIVGPAEDDPAIQTLIEAADAICADQVPVPALFAAPLDETTYRQMLDVRECIVAHGWDLPEPPSLEVWQEQAPIPWHPFTALDDPDRGPRLTDAEFAELVNACPQGGGPRYGRTG